MTSSQDLLNLAHTFATMADLGAALLPVDLERHATQLAQAAAVWRRQERALDETVANAREDDQIRLQQQWAISTSTNVVRGPWVLGVVDTLPSEAVL